MSKSDTRYLINETPWKCILKFAIPLFFGTFVQQVYSLADAAIAGRFIGSDALAAVGTNMPITNMIMILFIGISIGANVLISQNYGAENKEIIRTIIDTFMILIYALSIILMISLFLLSNILHDKILNTPAEVRSSAILYMNITLIGIVGTFGYNGISASLRALGDSKTPLILLVISNVVNILLSLLFVAQFELGVFGLAAATSISQILSFIVGIIFVNTKSKIIQIHFLTSKFDIKMLQDIIKIGLPSGLQNVFIAVGAFALQSLVNSFGVATMAGFNTASRIEFLIVFGINNFGQALSVFWAQNVGAGRYDRVKIGVRSTLIMASILMLSMSLIVYIFCRQFLMLFSTDPLVINEGVIYIRTVSPFYITAVVLFVVANGIRGTGATIVPMLVTALGHLGIRVPLAYLFVHLLESPLGIWYAMPVSWSVTSIISWLYYKSNKWKKYIRVNTNQ